MPVNHLVTFYGTYSIVIPMPVLDPFAIQATDESGQAANKNIPTFLIPSAMLRVNSRKVDPIFIGTGARSTHFKNI